jgi:hypothetical protein
MTASTTRTPARPVGADATTLTNVLNRMLVKFRPSLMEVFDPEAFYVMVLGELRDYRSKECKRRKPYSNNTLLRLIAAGAELDTYAVHTGKVEPWIITANLSVREQLLRQAATALVAERQAQLNCTPAFASDAYVTRHYTFLGHYVCRRAGVYELVLLYGETSMQNVAAVFGSGEPDFVMAFINLSHDPYLVEASRRLQALLDDLEYMPYT